MEWVAAHTINKNSKELMMESLAVKYRPQKWEDVTEQTSVVKILQNQIETNNIRNAYVFCGQTGSGKTTCARIFANNLNKGVGKPIEIDAASNNGVDNIRNIIQSASERSVYGKYKIFILDEAHMLSTQAWNASLKLIEEPPEYSVFIFCTTDPQKIPDTIMNRVQRFNFKKISIDGIVSRLKYICNCENIQFEESALQYIARLSNGGMRDAISLLDKCTSLEKIVTNSSVIEFADVYDIKPFMDLLNAMIDGNDKKVLMDIERYYESGKDLQQMVSQFFVFLLDISKYYLLRDMSVTKLPVVFEEDIKNLINFDNCSSYYDYLLSKVLNLKNTLKGDTSQRETIEFSFLQMARCK